MSRLVRLGSIFLFGIHAVFLFGGGRGETEWQPLPQGESWVHEYDLEGLDPGTYNVLIRGVDGAGNETLEGPFNVQIDPNSNLPTGRVIYPEDKQVVSGDLSVTGIAVDDDGIDFVEVQIDEGPFVRAEGTEYWRVLFPNTPSDGVHTLTVRPTDIHGVLGNSTSSTFIFDSQGPSIFVDSMESGALVGGVVRIDGRVVDTNGVESLVLQPEQNLRLRGPRRGSEKSFSFAYDTRDLPDGPHILTLDAVDSTGKKVSEPILIFVDNTPPELHILEPQPETPVSGVTTYLGRVQDAVGIQRIGYKFGGQEFEIPRTPGDLYWSATLDISSAGRRVQVEFFAEDTRGNRTTLKYLNPYDEQSARGSLVLAQDKEVLSSEDVLVFRTQGGVPPYRVLLEGVYSDGPREREFSDQLILRGGDFEPGLRNLKVTLTDSLGVQGVPFTKRITVLPPQPELQAPTLQEQEAEPRPWYPGIEVNGRASTQIHGTLTSAGAIQVLEAQFRQTDAPETWSRLRTRPMSPGVLGYILDIPRGITPGLWSVDIRGQDEFDQPFSQSWQFLVQDQSIPPGGPHILLDGQILSPGTLIFDSSFPRQGRVISRTLDDDLRISIQPETDLVELQTRGSFFSLLPRTTGSIPQVQLIGEDSAGRRFQSSPFGIQVIANALQAPPIDFRLQDDETGILHPLGQPLVLEGNLTGNLEELAVSISIGGTPPKNLRISSTEDPRVRTFRVSIPSPSEPSNEPLSVLFEGTNNSGQSFRREYSYYFVNEGSNSPVQAGLLFPLSVLVPNTDTLILGNQEEVYVRFLGDKGVKVKPTHLVLRPVGDSEPLVSTTLRDDGFVLVSRTAGRQDLLFEIEDEDGLTYEFGPYSVVVDLASPDLRIIDPIEGAGFAGLPSFALEIADDSTPVEELVLSARVVSGSESPWIDIPTENAPLQNVDIQSLSPIPGPLTVQFRVSDGSGKVTYAERTILYDPNPAEISLYAPEESLSVNGRTSVHGRIQSVFPLESLDLLVAGEVLERVPVPFDVRTGFFSIEVDFTQVATTQSTLSFEARTVTGQVSQKDLLPQITFEDDLPTIQIQSPAEGQMVSGPLSSRGMVFDDDGVETVFWRLNGGEWESISATHTFEIPAEDFVLSDNEQVLEVYGVDVFGLPGSTETRSFFSSTQPPEVTVDLPGVEQTVRGLVVFQGLSRDSNGISRVDISLDNGVSFLEVQGTEEWTYPLDTRVFDDGTYSVQVRAMDTYGSESRIFTLITIDNTPPDLDLSQIPESPSSSEPLILSGRLFDEGGIDSLELTFEPINRQSETVTRELSPEEVFLYSFDLSSFDSGWYNLRLTAKDRGGNETSVVQNILLESETQGEEITLLFPLVGETRYGRFMVEGRALGMEEGAKVELLIDDRTLAQGLVDPQGYFRIELTEVPGEGPQYHLRARVTDGDKTFESQSRSFFHNPLGPSLVIEEPPTGSLLADRPWIAGSVALPQNEEGTTLGVDELRVSLDNGRTFESVRVRDGKWRYRVETEDLLPGPLPILVDAALNDGTRAVTRALYTIDKTYPTVNLLSPSEGARLNEQAIFRGLARDNHGFESLEIALRQGDKAGYSVPSFIQGMYLDGQFGGLTYWKIGLGLTFFDENVKLQANFGVGPRTTSDGEPARLSGYFIGGKLLANLFSLPFESFLGPDWSWLSMNVALGADFSYISLYDPIVVENPGGGVLREEPGVVLSAIVLQIEFPRIRVPNLTSFHTYSLYTEPQIWFIPSDVSPSIAAKLTFGLRIGLF
ncbi:MAG: hypothetical protein GW949_01545 [Spirochaetales bacterium]|nr:hypothetical protein [Spirochaetales bacterium]